MARIPTATPSAPAPRPSQAPPALAAAIARLLTAPVVVVAPDGEHELAAGALSIGRAPESNVCLDDSLVSRTHARIVVLRDAEVAVEDLHSTNGVWVNGVRLGRNSQRLREGDRLLIGTCELSVFGARASDDRTPAPRAQATARSSVEHDGEGSPTTDRADALNIVGRLAERLNRAGNTIEAVRVLSGHLNKVLLGASAGLAVPETLLDDASRYAIALFGWTYNAAWLDYLVELHLTAQRLPSESSLSALESALGTPSGMRFDAELLRYFVESLETQRSRMNLNEEARLLRLHRLSA
jgi:pSer/pThr/pTyr-binding forkhead associated (FHA) protein